jgi:hypothetical protein
MGHYIANLRDIEFLLFDLFEREKVLGSPPFEEYDRDTAVGMLEEMKRLSENELAESFVAGDREGVTFVADGRARRIGWHHDSANSSMGDRRDGPWF